MTGDQRVAFVEAKRALFQECAKETWWPAFKECSRESKAKAVVTLREKLKAFRAKKKEGL